MPRGVPRAKQDESAMRFTSFHVPLPPNPKHMGTTYLKSESQTLWARNAARAGKNRSVGEDTGTSTPNEGRRGSKVIVIHPGSRWLRIGRASDVTPASIPNVIARKHKPPVPPLKHVAGISRPEENRERGHVSTVAQASDEYSTVPASEDPFDTKVAAIQVSLRDRMRFYKLRVTANAATVASTFNEQFKPETIPDANDPFRIDWIMDTPEEEFLVGEKALQLSDPQKLGYVLRWPIYCGNFNTRDYPSNQLILADVETIIEEVLKEKFGIPARSFKEHSVVLVIPDFYDRAYVQNLARTLLSVMGFKQLCVQQESLAATYGAGISNGCVVDMGAVTTSIACVDDGLVMHDTRMSLNMGGDDISEFLHVLLQKINFPYRDLVLARSYDWNVMEDLKSRLCTLAEGDVALNLYDFFVRRPGKPTEKYGLRAYDETILAPMCLFEPRVIEFDSKRAGARPFCPPDVTDEAVEQTADHVTQAMMISTQHLFPSALPTPAAPLETPTTTQNNEGQNAALNGNAMQLETATAVEVVDSASDTAPDTMDTLEGSSEPKAGASVTSTSALPPVEAPAGDAITEDAIRTEINVDADDGDTKPVIVTTLESDTQTATPVQLPQPQPTYPGGYAIDVCFEASKLPLDVAIFNSARAAGGDEKIRKYLQAVLIIGGTALVPGMGHALESRLQAIATPLVPNMEKVQIIPPPKDVDPRVLAWKGAAVLGKMDGVADLWVTAEDWDILGMRGLKERCFYL